MPKFSRLKRHCRKICTKEYKEKTAAKKLKLEAEIEIEPIEDSYDMPSDFDLPIITEVKNEYLDDSLGVHVKL